MAAFTFHERSAGADLTSTIVDVVVNGGNDYVWDKVEPAGALCGNGSQYKFFVHRTASPNVLFYLEGGGACWDYDTCSGRAGKLGAANPNGIEDDYMAQLKAQYVSPIVNGADPGLPLRSRTDLVTKDWNVVFMPYCTGDVHVGQATATYTDPTGAEPPLTFHHDGFQNALAAIDYAKNTFGAIDKLFVSGFSAGGTGTSALYWFIRQGLPAQSGYMLNDSGPPRSPRTITTHDSRTSDSSLRTTRIRSTRTGKKTRTRSSRSSPSSTTRAGSLPTSARSTRATARRSSRSSAAMPARTWRRRSTGTSTSSGRPVSRTSATASSSR